MVKDTSQLNLIQKLACIRKEVAVVEKNKQGYGYKYATDVEILTQMTPKMNEMKVSLIPSLHVDTLQFDPISYQKKKFDKSGKELTVDVNETKVTAQYDFTWVNDENPEEKITIPWFIIGQQEDPSQAFGSALTYARRYFLLQFFSIASVEGNPEDYRAKMKEIETREEREATAAILEKVEDLCKTFKEKHPNDTAVARDVCKKYAANGNYTKITDPETASKLFEDLTATIEAFEKAGEGKAKADKKS